MKPNKFAWCLGLLFAASTCFAQMYTVTAIADSSSFQPIALNDHGQVILNHTPPEGFPDAAFWDSSHGLIPLLVPNGYTYDF